MGFVVWRVIPTLKHGIGRVYREYVPSATDLMTGSGNVDPMFLVVGLITVHTSRERSIVDYVFANWKARRLVVESRI